MRATVRTGIMTRLSHLRRMRRARTAASVSLFILVPVLAILTFVVLGPMNTGLAAPSLRVILLVDLIYVLVVASIVLQRVARMVAARRAKSAGSRLHMRLTGVFALVALFPTVLVAIFAAFTVSIGLEGWFSERVRQVVSNSSFAAQAYETEQKRDLITDAQVLARFLNASRRSRSFVADGEIRQMLNQGQSQIQRGLREAFVIDGVGNIRSRGENSYLFDYEKPEPGLFTRALAGETVLIQDWDINEFRALVMLDAFVDRFLYVTRDVDGDILNLLADTQETVKLYYELENERGRLLFEFGLLYIGFAVILLLAAIWLGMWFAERLSRPVGRLAGAAQRVGGGDLDVQVIEEEGDDEIAMLGRLFNQMTRQLKGQREALLDNNRKIEDRERLFDSVLSSVTGGVIGLDSEGLVTFVNRAAVNLLKLESTPEPGTSLKDAAAEFSALFEQMKATGSEVAQEEIRLTRSRKLEDLLVRVATMRNTKGELDGYVIAFDDVTDLVSAQRMAAWGDVARRIAHEIKNPLTPIQLSAERLKRKFAPLVGELSEDLEQYSDVIIRQTNDLRRIVDEFSKFARMPEPERRENDLAKLLTDVVLLQQNGQPDVNMSLEKPEGLVCADIDETMIGQALTNMIKNAGEAIETRNEKEVALPFSPEIRVTLATEKSQAVITISDNGIGLPEDRARLFEPYVTTRTAGTGLGLPIVKKIVQEHGGTLELVDAEAFAKDNSHCGAKAIIRLPLKLGQESRPEVKQKANVN